MSDIPVIVAVRCRPLVHKEIEEGANSCVAIRDNKVQIDLGKNLTFTFDHTFSGSSTQAEVYNKCGIHLIDNLFKGYNATIFAYGQTGSGKTHTMGTGYFGNEEQGIVPLAMRDIFSRIQHDNVKSLSCSVSFLEVYNEEIYDLLNLKGKQDIAIREDCTGIKITGLKEVPVTSVQEVYQLLTNGSVNRKTGKTNMNQHSSRSHALFSLNLEQKELDGSEVCLSKFHFVDLAGSERAKKTGAHGARFKEGININRGLLALGNVISSLCENSSHIPYRDSKLTRLLQDSLGGNSHTVMLACISPSDTNAEETVNTLRYADRAKKIKNKPIINKDPKIKEIEDLRRALTNLQKEHDMHMLKCPFKDKTNLRSVEEVQEDEEATSMTYVSFCIDDLDIEDRYKDKLRMIKSELKRKNAKIQELDMELKRTMMQFAAMCGKVIALESEHARTKEQLSRISHKAQIFVQKTPPTCDESITRDELDEFRSLIASTLELSQQRTPQSSPVKCCKMEDMDDLSELMAQGATICQELHNVESEIQEKEFLRSKTFQTSEELNRLKAEYESAIESLKSELEQKKKEREELEAKKNPVLKVSEDRRQKIKDLQNQIEGLQRKLTEKTKMLDLKKEQEKKVQILDKEIQHLKTARVRLMKQMDLESKKSQHMMVQMKRMEMQKDKEKNKMDLAMTKQKAANDLLTRKLNDAQMAKKRLQESITRQRQTVQERAKFMQKGGVPAAEKIRQWLSHDIDLELCRHEAREQVQSLKDDRAQLSKDLLLLQSQLQNLPIQESTEKETVDREICRLQLELDRRTDNIKSIQKDVLSGGGDDLSEQARWNSVYKLSEAKCGLAYLFDQVVNMKVKLRKLIKDHEGTNSAEHDLRTEISKLKKEIESNERKAKEKINLLQNDLENQTCLLLKELKGGDHPDADDKAPKQQLEFIYAELSQRTEECHALQRELDLYKLEIGQAAASALANSPDKPVMKTPLPFLKSVKPKNLKVSFPPERVPASLVTETDEEPAEETGSDSSDPDWRLTPFLKQFKAWGKAPRVPKRKARASISDSDQENSDTANRRKGLKHQSSAASCGCKGSCNRGNCGCKRNNRSCDENCKCSKDICVNRPNMSDSASGSSVLEQVNVIHDQLNSEDHETKESPEHPATARTQRLLATTRSSILQSTPLPKLDSKKLKFKDGNSSFFKPL